MDARAWSNGGSTYGIRVGVPNVRKYFRKNWKIVRVNIDGEVHEFKLTKSFWSTCPEFRGKAVKRWLRKHRLISWPKGRPPRLKLVPLGSNKFRLRLS